MDTPDFPSNSERAKPSKDPVDKKLERVTTGDVVRKRKSLRKQFTDVFIAGTAKSASQYVVMEVLLPNARDTISELVSSYTDRILYGDRSRRRGGATPPQSGPTGNIQYNRPYASRAPWAPASTRALSREARAKHNFDELVLQTRVEAEDVIDRLYDVVSRYESASVADLYELVGLSATHTDYKWGWTDLRGAGVQRVRDGYLLDLPNPEPLDD